MTFPHHAWVNKCDFPTAVVRGSGDPSTIPRRVASASQDEEKEYDED